VHSDALTAAATDWWQIVQLYNQLMVLAPSPVVALHRAVAVAEVDGPEVGLALVERLDLPRHRTWYAVRADLLRRLDRSEEAAAAYDAAIALTDNERERAFLRGRRESLGS
jgi:RNA polymerase sigma-70 factor (ECF subfamily)